MSKNPTLLTIKIDANTISEEDVIMEFTEYWTKTLIAVAKEASAFARAHKSNYHVGAAILSDGGRVYKGCNFEFDNYSNTVHAEEAALSALISDSKSALPVVIAVYTIDNPPAFPCGMCLQSLSEYGGDDLVVIACNDTTHERMLMRDLLPRAYSTKKPESDSK